jgi:beta-galactosidase
MTREHSLDIGWRFHLGQIHDGQSPQLDDSGWRLLDVPHDWSIELERRADAPGGASGGFFQDGVGWYRRHFDVPEDWAGKRVWVEFDGVYREAEVWINGRYLGLHPYGYTSFHYDLAQYLKPGEDNVLAVRVDNSTHKHTRWYSGSGIYRHVRLGVAGPVHVAPWGLFVTTPEASDTEATVSVRADIANCSAESAAAVVRWTIADADGTQVGSGEAAGTVAASGSSEIAGEIRVVSPSLWSPDAPRLYTLSTMVSVGDAVVDEMSTTFGIRTFTFSPQRGFVLNGVATPMRGGCVHHDCGPLGAASIDRAEERKVELLKASGFNAIRCAHNPPSPAFLDACDRLGMLVIDEAFDVWRAQKLPHDYHRHFDDWWQRDLDSMILRDRNHPCIVLWSIGNELFERGLPEGAEIAGRLAARVRELDTTRPVTAGICGMWAGEDWRVTDGLFEHLDVCGYNYQIGVYESDRELFPERVIIATESFPPQAYDYWEAVENLPWVAGDFVWTSLDYLGEAGIGRTYIEGEPDHGLPEFPWNQANCGDIDLCGGKRPQSFYRDVLWDRAERPYIAVHPPAPDGKEFGITRWGWHDVRESWNWDGLEGQELKVDVYFDCDDVELLVNGESAGREPAGANSKHIASFCVPYAPGRLEAIARSGGQEVARAVLETTGEASRLHLQPDRAAVRADRNDLACLTVEVLDDEGRVVPVADNTVFFTVGGPGRIAAVANADPKNAEPYRGNVHSVWRGRGLVMVQPTGEPGRIVVRAQADGLGTCEGSVTAEPSQT